MVKAYCKLKIYSNPCSHIVLSQNHPSPKRSGKLKAKDAIKAKILLSPDALQLGWKHLVTLNCHFADKDWNSKYSLYLWYLKLILLPPDANLIESITHLHCTLQGKCSWDIGRWFLWHVNDCCCILNAVSLHCLLHTHDKIYPHSFGTVRRDGQSAYSFLITYSIGFVSLISLSLSTT